MKRYAIKYVNSVGTAITLFEGNNLKKLKREFKAVALLSLGSVVAIYIRDKKENRNIAFWVGTDYIIDGRWKDVIGMDYEF